MIERTFGTIKYEGLFRVEITNGAIARADRELYSRRTDPRAPGIDSSPAVQA